MDEYLEDIKVEAALRSEEMKLEYRQKNKPEEINILDYTVIAALRNAKEKAPTKIYYDGDTTFILCPNCDGYVGTIEDEDGEEKYNYFNNYCSDCGQRIKKVYDLK